MSEIVDQIDKLKAKAHSLKEGRKYLEALKKFDELIAMQKEMYGEKSDDVM